jgi:hypothetical protein
MWKLIANNLLIEFSHILKILCPILKDFFPPGCKVSSMSKVSQYILSYFWMNIEKSYNLISQSVLKKTLGKIPNLFIISNNKEKQK